MFGGWPMRRNHSTLGWVAAFLLAAAGLAALGHHATDPAAAASAPPLAPADPFVLAVGDIACDPTNASFNGGLGTSQNCRQKYTSDLAVGSGAAAVLVLGDNQYYCGGYQAFLQSYDLSWGRVKDITKPAVGNHEYLTSGGTDCNAANTMAAGYFKYFGAAAGDPTKGYYSYDIGTWHLIVLNSNCGGAGGCSATSPQGQWLRADLAAHPNYCTLAYWHVPLFSSGGRADSTYKTFWDALYAADADVVLAGHDHLYERFAPQRPDATADPTRGIREFVVGSGGANHTSFTNTIFANSQVRNDTTYGVLKLALHPTSYDWEFQHEAGATFTDSGTTQCHGVATDTTPPTPPTNLTASATAPSQVSLAWTAATDNQGIAAYRVFRDGSLLTTVTGTGYVDGSVAPSSTHSYYVVAVDAGGNVSPASNTVTATTPADTSAPSAPTGLTATAANGYLVNLAWTASTDDVGIAGYDVWRNGAYLASTTGTTYADASVDASTAYTYTLVARDLAGNPSVASAPASVTTPAAPTVLTFTPSDDAYVQSDVATTNFGSATQIVVDASPVRRTLLKFTVTGVRGRTVTSALVKLANVDGSGVGGNFHRVASSSWSEATVNWNNQPAADTAVLASLGTVAAGNTYSVDLKSLITADGTYTIAIDSTSGDGAYYSSKEGATAPRLVVTTSGPADTSPPTTPTGLTAPLVTSSRVNLAWTASSDNLGVASYQVLRNGVAVGTSTTTTYADTTVASATSYTYTVVARDAAGNPSNPSAPLSVTTPTGSSSIRSFTPVADSYVESDAATTNFGFATQIGGGGLPDRHGLMKFTVAGTAGENITSATLVLACENGSTVGGDFHPVADSSWSEGGVTWNNQPAIGSTVVASLGQVSAGSTYSVDISSMITGDGTYTVEFDSTLADGAYYSSKEGATAPKLVVTTAGDTTKPSAPTALSATASSPSRVDLAWTASTDNVGVTGYQILRGGTVVGTSTTTAYADTAVVQNTSYTYTVVALDAAGNASDPSAPATVTTPSGPTVFTFTPVADSYVQGDTAATNYGSAVQVVADASPLRRALLKFTVTGTGGQPIKSAVLRLACVDGSPNGGAFHRVADNGWTEGGVTWNNQPAADSATLASLAQVSAGTTYSVNVAPLITGDGTYTIEFDSTSSDGAYYSSKEGASPAQLVVTVGP
jgi:chitodextrinase